MILQFRALVAIVGMSLVPLLLRTRNTMFAQKMVLSEPFSGNALEEQTEKCAICFFGLPRSFELLVLPSVIENVFKPNMAYGCDIFAHYYDIGEEEPGRATKGGKINTTAMAHLKESVEELYQREFPQAEIPDVVIVRDTNETFWDVRGKAVENYRHAKAPDGNFKYFPWKDTSYNWPTSTDNIVKQWHSINGVWELMEEHGKVTNTRYTRVAMLRSDVVYVKPIDIYETAKKTPDQSNNVAVIPRFATYPVNDRMIYGPYGAVKVWATERFARLEQHALDRPGFGMHSEKYLKDSILPVIEDDGFILEQSPHICFFRARADGQVHIRDCDDSSRFADVSPRRKMKWIEEVSNVTCTGFLRHTGTMNLRRGYCS